MKVAILGHLLTKKEYRSIFPFGKYLPLSLMEWIISILPDKKKSMLISHFNILDKAEGYVVGIALTSEQIMKWDKERVRKIILDAILYAQNKLGCDLVMLGALTAPATSAGLWLREQPEVKLSITTGNTYTAAIAIEGAEKAITLAQLKNPKMAIVGAAGVIGEAIVKYFNANDFDLILVEREMDRFERLEPQLKGDNYVLTDKIADIVKADIIITATSHPEALIIPGYLKHNAIVVDVAEPSDVVADIEEKRPDVISIDGGRVKWEKVNIKFNLGLVKNVGFACMTEGMMQALENDHHDYIGSVDMEHLKETIAWGKKWDFPIADFTCFNKEIPFKKFNDIRHE
jgi:predicted amino acid dehydrogenase